MFSLFAKISESFLKGHRILYVSKMIMFFFILCRIHFCSVGSVSLLNYLKVYLPEKPPKHFMVYLTHSVGNNSAGRTNSLKFMKYIDVE